MNHRDDVISICQDVRVDVDVDVDLNDIPLEKLTAHLARRMQKAGAASDCSYLLDPALVQKAYEVLPRDAPEPLRELVMELTGRIA